MPRIADFLERNKAVQHKPLPFLQELREQGSQGPSTIIITCLDPRCVPETFFDLHAGEVLVHRNAGGSVKTALRDIATLDALFNLEEICIIHHTDCGTTHISDEEVREHIRKGTDKSNYAEIDNMEVYTIQNIEESVKADLEWVRETPFIRSDLKKGAQGFVFDIKTGLVTKVEPKTPI
ncbi:hypothetical protein Sste5346_002086 [Sporothrix stenoceras]|uniref:Carbonic anhydrase n=1 Tax=Sporothrix stenoceras TaxID=5173 RepID=A0ABR3ZK27_9PEZI